MRIGILLAMLSFAGVVSVARAETAETFTCTKDGKDVKVTGKTAQDKKKACEAQGATWAKAATEEPQKKQDAGGGGGW